MAVNLKDDYEKLAKLLYPSIEASGNVYYGTTRKLTIDALLDKTDIGFESHVESENYEGIHYIPRFYWKLGPLSSNVYIGNVIENGIINASTFDDDDIYHYDVYRMYQDGSVDEEPITGEDPIYGTFFAKYKLVFNTSKIDNLTNNSNFPTYESSVSVGDPECIIVTDNFDPSNPTGYNIYNIENRHFYITKEGNDFILYIQIASCKQPSYIDEFKNEPITFESHSIGHFNSTVSLRAIGGYDTSDGYTCQYRTYKEDLLGNVFLWSLWTNYTLGTSISLSALEKVQFRCNGSAPQQTANNHYLTFDTTGRLTVYGNAMSLLDEDFASAGITYYKCGLRNLFGGCSGITDAANLVLNSDLDAQHNYLYNGSYDSMFYGCSDLKYAPKELPATSLLNNPAYEDMFQLCSNLETAPKIKAITLSENCCRSMFANCSNLVSGPEILPADSLATMCYYGMFSGCTNLEVSPKLPATSFGDADLSTASPYEYMFNGCTSLNKVYINLVNSLDDIDGTYFLEGTSSGGDFIVNKHADWIHCTYYTDFLDGNWSLVVNNIDDSAAESDRGIYFYSHSTGFCCTASHTLNTTDYMITSGTDSPDNGRGYISDESTIYNMEESFDENHTHSFDEFNVNGSYNQEIWGYKSFNSPVQFRNGIYTDSMSVTSPQAYTTFSFIDDNGYSDDAEFDEYSSFSISTLKINEDICPVSKNIAFSAYSVPYEIYDTTIHDYTERIDYISKDALVSSLSNNETNHVISTGTETGMFSSVSTCAITKLLPEHTCIDPEPFRDSIKRYKSSMTAGESFVEVTADYSDENTLQNSSVNVMLVPSLPQLCGITMSDLEFSNTTTDISFSGKDITILNSRNFLDNSFYDNYRYGYMQSGNIIEQYSGVLHDDLNDLEYNTSSTIIKSKEYGGPGTNLVESTIEASSSYDVSSNVVLESTSDTPSNSGNYIGSAKVILSSLLAAKSGGTIIAPPPVTVKLTSEVIDDNDISTKSEFKVSPNGCSIDEVPIVPPVRSFTGSPIFTKGSVHILVVTNFNQLIKIECGSIISSGTYQGNRNWHVGDHAFPGTIIELGKLCIGAAGIISVDTISPGYPNESMQFKVLNCRNASDTDKSLIVISMTDQSNANV